MDIYNVLSSSISIGSLEKWYEIDSATGDRLSHGRSTSNCPKEREWCSFNQNGEGLLVVSAYWINLTSTPAWTHGDSIYSSQSKIDNCLNSGGLTLLWVLLSWDSLMLPPRPFLVSESPPATKMLVAALISLSWDVPQLRQIHSRIERSNFPILNPQQEQVLEVGSHLSMTRKSGSTEPSM